MLGDRLAIGHDPGQHAAYVQSWIKVLQDDPLELFRAARDAERITEYVLGLEQRQEVGETRASIPHASIPHASIPQQAVSLPDRSSTEGESMRIATEEPLVSLRREGRGENAGRPLGPRGELVRPPGTDLERSPGGYRRTCRSGGCAWTAEEFAAALREAGLRLDGLPGMDGRMHRVPVEGASRPSTGRIGHGRHPRGSSEP
jgi:hypothetical protein